MRGKIKHIIAALSGESHSNGVFARRMAALDGTGRMDEDGSTLGEAAEPVARGEENRCSRPENQEEPLHPENSRQKRDFFMCCYGSMIELTVTEYG